MREILSNCIYLLYNGQLVKLYAFDFGSNNIPEEFYVQSFVDNSMGILSKGKIFIKDNIVFRKIIVWSKM